MGGRRAGPERTCVGCRRRSAKRDLLRVVRAPDGTLRVDRVGSAPGRGAYVHRDAGCIQAASDRGALARALRAGGSSRAADRLRAEIEESVRHA